MTRLTTRQLEKHIRACAADTGNVVFVQHARQRMVQRHIQHAMVLETLRKGNVTREPEPDPKAPGVRCQMEYYVSGTHVGVVVYVEYPAPDICVITVMEVRKR